jgi:predicted DCC family thiol-disulfide oxidoreductase YuxK
MSGTQARWILAFDASCGTCRGISRAVAEACDGKLKLMPLAHPDVRQWREQSLGSQAAWAPTLIRIQVDDVRAWTGPAMVVALVRHLGSRSTMRVLGALMQQRRNRDQVVPLNVGLLAVVGSLMMTSRRGAEGRSKRTHAPGSKRTGTASRGATARSLPTPSRTERPFSGHYHRSYEASCGWNT